jgi:hypothetical protein
LIENRLDLIAVGGNPEVMGRAGTAIAIGLVAVILAGCGGDSEKPSGANPSANPQGTADPQGKADPNKNPFQATCEDYLNSPQLYSEATVKLARRVHLQDANEYQVMLRLRNAVTAICGQADPDSRPAQKAVDAVKQGKYKTERG